MLSDWMCCFGFCLFVCFYFQDGICGGRSLSESLKSAQGKLLAEIS